MAILPGAPGFKVEVLVNGSVAQEYSGDEVADPNTTTKYIEAISGAPFRVAYSINSEHSTTYVGEGVKVRVYLDGKEVFGRLIRAQPDFDGKRRYCNGAENHYFQKSYLERFRFSEFKIVENDGALTSKELKTTLESTGKISIMFWRLKDIKPCSQVKDKVRESLLRPTVVSEKAVAPYALSHHGTLDSPQEVTRCRRSTGTLIDNKDKPYAVFNFKYRSLASLKLLRIIPRTPSPVPLEQRPTNDLNFQEALDLVNRYRDREAAQAQNVKNEVKNETKREYQDDSEVVFVSEKRRKTNRSIPKAGDEVVELD